jgi:hypothetical protein
MVEGSLEHIKEWGKWENNQNSQGGEKERGLFSKWTEVGDE